MTENKQTENTPAEEVKTQRVPEAPYGPKISSITQEGIEYYWKKPELADGYEVFRSYAKGGPFKSIKLIPKRGVGTYLDTEFDRSKREVYYTIRSYVDQEDGTRSFSELLEAKAAEFRDKMIPERDHTVMYSGTTRKIRVFWGWGEPEDAQWSSDDENIATISQDGVITAVSQGTCTLRCKSASVGQTASTKVIVDRQADPPLAPINPRFTYDAEQGCWVNPNAPKTNDAVIMMVGDMMCGKRQMQTQYNPIQGWNFNSSFDYVKEITATADLNVGNLETLLAAGWPYMTDEVYIDNTNNCNVTPRYLDGVRHGGFDAVTMSNNHNCDGGKRALLDTISQVDRYQLARTGVFLNGEEKRFFIAQVNGIKVGYLAYTSKSIGFNKKEASWPTQDINTHLNLFTQAKARKDIADCRAAGAEYVIVYMHWGFKNFRNVAKHQIEEAQLVADAGADYIVGANPHVLQVYDVIRSKDGRDVPCAYSTGNFLAVMNQVVGNRDSIILRIRLQKDAGGKVTLAENNYIPCYCYPDILGHPWAPVSVSLNINSGVKRKNRKVILERIADTIGKKIKRYKPQ